MERGQLHGGALLFALVGLALLLAIGFFYLTDERRSDRRADALTNAAASADDAARIVSDAARNAAEQFRNGH